MKRRKKSNETINQLPVMNHSRLPVMCAKRKSLVVVLVTLALISVLARAASLTGSGESPTSSYNMNQFMSRAPSPSPRQHNTQIVFPAPAAKRRPTGSQPIVYVNPQPSPTSPARSRFIVLDPHIDNPHHSDTSGSQNRKPSRPTGSVGSTPSSIGKSERQQVAEWPFFKSLQSARQSNQMQMQIGNNNQQVDSNAQQSSSTAQFMQPTGDILRAATTGAKLTTSTPLDSNGDAPASSASTSQPVVMTTSISTPSAATTTITTTSEPSQQANSITTTAEPTTSEAPQETTTTTTTTSTTTTPTPPTSTTVAAALDRDQLSALAPVLAQPAQVHKAIQTAVDRLVEMGAAAAADVTRASGPVVRLSKPHMTTSNSTRPATSEAGARSSSLSLNVLLKNFGTFNLSSLDQILLKSSWNKNNNNKSEALGPADQRIAINGLHKSQVTQVTGSNDRESISQPLGGSNSTTSGGECKIEYTMKHVNISLANDDSSDYTCDYIIDRKLGHPTESGPGTPTQQRNICKLHMRSAFFANESTGSQEEEGAICAGATYLSIGKMNFCHIGEAGEDQEDRKLAPPLDRMFDFPVDREAFDVRLVHKSTKGSIRTSEDNETGGNQQLNQPAGDIYLEIRPMDGITCVSPPAAEGLRKPLGASNRVASATPTSTQAATPTSELRPKRKFLLKVVPEKQLHPLNNMMPRTTSQTFDHSISVGGPLINLGAAEPPLCSELAGSAPDSPSSVHVSTVGQLTTPNYPGNYSDNVRCRHLIKRVSASHCQLLLHFRDFDLISSQSMPLINRALQSPPSGELCSEDYLQIGETRYCNRYAMIGHKMYLNFSRDLPAPEVAAIGDETITLVFSSDAQRTGRGFLIKYQQLACSEENSNSRSNRTTTETSTIASTTAVARQLQTVAPPLQQPDFSLALKTQRPAAGSKPDRTEMNSNNRTEKLTKASKRMQQPSGNNNGLLQTAATTSATSRAPPDGQVNSSPHLPGESAAPPTTSASNIRRELTTSTTCNQVNYEMTFLISSYNYPSSYLNNLQCLYYVRKNSSRVCYLELTFLKFDLEADNDCRYDYLEVNNVRLCGTLRSEEAGTKITRIYLFDEALKLIKFKSDSLHTRDGFLIKVDQLECSPNSGAIVRQQSYTSTTTTTPMFMYELEPPSSRSNGSSSSTRMFEYDSSLVSGGARTTTSVRNGPNTINRGRSLLSGGGQTTRSQKQSYSSGCDDLLYGSEVTIKSPNWPESYTHDEALNSCKYTIVRTNNNKLTGDLAARNKLAICQLELRFVHLRLGFGDCLDIGDGQELLCGFNTRNLVRYFPFNERQTHLSITFTTGAANAKFALGRAASSSVASQLDHAPHQNHSDLLPSLRAPFRFMIIARQLECVDDFLAPQVDLDVAPPPPPPPPSSNATNLLYSGGSESDRKSTNLAPPPPLPVVRPRYVNRTRPSYSGELDNTRRQADGQLMYSFANSMGATTTNTSSSTASPPPSTQSVTTNKRQSCLIQFNQYNGILTSSQIVARAAAATAASDSSTTTIFDEPEVPPRPQECEIRVKLLPGFCQLQLNFNDFTLSPGRRQHLCPGEHLELGGVQYCGQELRNSSRLLSTTLPGQRHISLRATLAHANAFRAIFKQLECEPAATPTLRPLVVGVVDDKSLPPKQTNERSVRLPVAAGAAAAVAPVMQVINLREIPVSGEFFELRSDQVSINKFTYDPAAFVIFKVARARPEVCKIRLLFYKFQLEPATPTPGGPMCQRDFLDVNNGQDRLCGTIDGTTREYDWPPATSSSSSTNAFQVSFVSDSSDQRAGFHIFGQQLTGGCSAAEPSTTTTTTTTTPMPTSTSTSAAPIGEAEIKTDEGYRQTGSATPTQSSPSGRAQLPGNCSQIITGNQLTFELSSPHWPRAYDAIGTCHYLISRAGADICSVTLRVNSLILDLSATSGGGDEADCPEDTSMSDYLELDGRRVCGLLTRPRTFTFDFGRPEVAGNSTQQRHFIMAKFVSNQARGFGFHIEGQQNRCLTSGSAVVSQSTNENNQVKFDENPRGQPAATPPPQQSSDELPVTEVEGQKAGSGRGNCNQLLTGQVNLLESENFPDAYANDQEANEVSGLCEADYLELDYSRFCGSYPSGHRLRFNYFGRELDKLLRFRSDATHRRTGFSLVVRQLAGAECVTSGVEVLTTTTGNAEQIAETTTTPPTSGELINYLPDSTVSSTQLSSEERNNGSSSVELLNSRQPSSTLCQFVYHNERQLLVSPNYNSARTHYEPNLDCQYKLIAANYDICSLRLTFLDLELEQSPDCLNDYLLIDSRRYCGSSTAHQKKLQLEFEFSSNLPRQIELLFHTDAHTNSGRGFKLLAEQLACGQSGGVAAASSSSSADQDFKMAALDADSVSRARQVRRLKFGQLNYPRNYVSESAGSGAPVLQRWRQEHAGKIAPEVGNQDAELSARKHKNLDDGELDLKLSKEIAVAGRNQQQQQQQQRPK